MDVDGRLRFEDGGNGFEGHSEDDVHAVGDAALHAARTVGQGAAAFGKEIVVL